MTNQNNFQFPVLIIKEVKPLLSKDVVVFAYEINVITQNGDSFKMYEKKGLDLRSFIGHEMECLIEITRGKFQNKVEEDKVAKNTIAFKYQWLKRAYEFFPQLVKMRDDAHEASSEEESKSQLFETTATKFFEEWGLNGLQIGIYQDKPVLSSQNGFFLLNEFEFEEDIEDLELNQEVYIRIDELFLRGIRPIPDNSKQKKVLAAKEVIVQPTPKQAEEPKQNKGRFNLFPDKNI